MIQPRETKLFHDPGKQFVEAHIVTLTEEMADAKISNGWWDDDSLMDPINPEPIDRRWDWNEVSIIHDGRLLGSEKVAVVAGDNGAVQGAMMISSEPVDSVLEAGERGLFVELLFTAPRNRRNLRKDGRDFLKGIGLELLTWGAWFSRDKGHRGRLLLDASPDSLVWYENRGLKRLPTKPIMFQGVPYCPMELSPRAAANLLRKWLGR